MSKQEFRVQLIGGHSDGGTLLISKVFPRIDIRPKALPDKPNIYVISGSYTHNGEILYVHEDIISDWRKQHI